MQVNPMGRWERAVTAFVVAIVGAGCSADVVAAPAAPVARIKLTADTMLVVGAAPAVVRLAFLDTAGVSAFGYQIEWTSSDPAVVAVRNTSFYGAPGAEIRGVAAGRAFVYATVNGLRDSLPIQVSDARPLVTLVLGDTVRDTLVNEVSGRRFVVPLQANDTVDILVMRSGGSGDVILRQTREGPALAPSVNGSGLTGLGAAYVAPTAGQYFFSAVGSGSVTRGIYTPASGSFALVVRRSAPIFAFTFAPDRWLPVQVRAGTTAVDTVWVENLGARTLTATLGIGAPFVLLRPTVSAVGPVRPDGSVGAAQRGAVAIPLQVDARTVAPGGYAQSLSVTLPAGSWGVSDGRATLSLNAQVYDSRIEVLSCTSLMGVVASPAGTLYAFAGSDLFTLDPVSGAATRILSVTGNIMQAAVSPDGTVDLAVADGRGVASVVKLAPGQQPVTIALPTSTTYTGISAIAAGADGSVYVRGGETLYRLASSGTFTSLASIGEGGQMALASGEGALYYIRASILRRFDLATNVETDRAVLPTLSLLDHVFAVDAQGRLYVNRENVSGLYVLSSQGALVSFVAPPASTLGFTLRGDTVYGVSLFASRPGFVWKMPLP